MNSLANLTGTYYPATPGARTWREATDLYIDGKRVSAVAADRTVIVFVGGEIVFDGTIPADINTPGQLHTWIAETAVTITAAEAATITAAEAATVTAAETITATAAQPAATHAATLSATATTAAEHRAAAAAFTQARGESIERSSEDGALTQWAHGLNAAEHDLAARIAEQGGTAEFDALFDLDGNLVPAIQVNGKFGWSWKLLDDRGRGDGWFNESNAKAEARRIAAHAAKGYYVGRVRVPARATLGGGNIACVMPRAQRLDNGFSADAQIIDNGHQAPAYAAA